jgi:hypothetical protein
VQVVTGRISRPSHLPGTACCISIFILFPSSENVTLTNSVTNFAQTLYDWYVRTNITTKTAKIGWTYNFGWRQFAIDYQVDNTNLRWLTYFCYWSGVRCGASVYISPTSGYELPVSPNPLITELPHTDSEQWDADGKFRKRYITIIIITIVTISHIHIHIGNNVQDLLLSGSRRIAI